ncbi:hypothetical protein KC845_00750 [Candidatus Kaiserbacteria bacterium]|nr:hypothetical protein [Candidatus Kaiserbacteria bacterium]
MSQKWNLQDIRPAQPKRRRASENVSTVSVSNKVVDREEADDVNIRIVDGNKKKRRTYLYAFIIFFVIVGGSLLISYLISGAEVTVYPRNREPNVNATVVAYKTPQAGELSYEIMSLEATGERQVSATGEEQVVEQATGVILVYNKHSTEPIRLITNTRFETNDGKIYRLKDSIVVPGYTKSSEGVIAPGVISADVFADQPGDEYNIGPSKFTIPGFAGSAEFDNVYGESIESMRGGFNGARFIIDEAELQTAKQALQLELRNSLLERIDAEKPAGMELFTGSITFTFETLPAVEYGPNLATIKEKATLRIPLFKKSDFASYVAKATIPGYEDVPVRIEDINTLTFSYTSATTSSTNIAAVDSIEFTLIGRPLIVWEYDDDKLKSDLVGKNRTALPSVLGGYPAIEKSEAITRPFWNLSFPDQPDDIKITEIIANKSE